MSVPLTLLGLLEREPSHGYDLKRDYDTWFGRGRPLPYGQVYATLSRLARDGKAIAGPAEHGEKDPTASATRSPTPASPTSSSGSPSLPRPSRTCRPVLFAKVVLALMLGQPAARYLDAQRAAHLHRMRELTELKQRGELVDTLLADYGLYHLEADLRWIDHTAARLDLLARAVRQ